MVCEYWKKGGFCKKAFLYMYLNCPQSCNFCGKHCIASFSYGAAPLPVFLKKLVRPRLGALQNVIVSDYHLRIGLRRPIILQEML